MKRSAPLPARKRGLAPGDPIRRRRGIRPVNRERLARLRAKQFGAKARFIASLACCSCGRLGPSDPAHVRSRGPNPTNETLVPLCRTCHRRQHARGWTALGAPRAHWLVVAASYETRWRALEAAA